MSHILVVGLNPAWQTVLGFRDFRAGEVNRARSGESLASGKGFNAAKVLRRLGHKVSLLQILGGENGSKCLRACEALGIESLHAWVGTETRRCLTLLHRDASLPGDAPDPEEVGAAPGESTEIIEPFRVEEPGAGEALIASLPPDPEAFDAVAICGTVPPGAGEGIYDAVLDRLRPKVTVVDAWQGLRPGSLAKATCLKMNRSEYRTLSESAGAEAADALFLVTSGGGEALVLRGGATLARLAPPRLASVANSIGAGDAVTAGVVHHLLSGLDAAEAFRHGLAMGSASCLERLPAEFQDAEFRRLLPLVRVLP
ncbi:MAG TPA: PfkB family carbohydrate kinase [Fibrobacteria bacterium]|nr:PfkB family carbohydrate kinase [Fibrobacteria bacterium]